MSGKWVFEPEALNEEVLVVLAQCDYVPARKELILRVYEPTSHLVWLVAKRVGLSVENCEDAAQNAFFAIDQAIDDYDTMQMGRTNGHTFRKFLYQRAQSRFFDFLRALRRVKKLNPSGPAAGVALALSASADAAAVAEEHEQQDRLDQVLAGLDESERETWECLKSAPDVAALAARWHMSYDAARRRRRQFLSRLRQALELPAAALAS